jgi:pimeloyl-ACP methyl ester carboxylesterase
VRTDYSRPMRSDLSADVPGGSLRGWVRGDGPPVLLLHGGPGLSYEYVDGLAADIGDHYRVAAFQQRGLAPSTTEGPFDIARAVADVVAVLDALGWDRAWILGHSWGGHLLLHVALAVPGRLLGGLAVDPLGGVGDGGVAGFEAELTARTPAEAAARATELDERAMRGEGTPEEMEESLRLLWPAYFASPDDALPFIAPRISLEAYAGLWESINAELPGLEAALPRITVPFGFVAGAESPMPAEDASAATAAAIPGAWCDILDGAGHYPYYERPGSMRAALDRLRMAGTTTSQVSRGSS